MSAIKISVIIVNYNGCDHTKACVESLNLGSHSLEEIIIVDNGSSHDDYTALKRDLNKCTKIVRLKNNIGYGGACNVGARSAVGNYVLFLNNDLEVKADFVDHLLLEAKKDPNTAILQPKILSSVNSGCFDEAGASGGFTDFLGYPFCRGRVFTHIEEDKGQYDNVQDILWCSGAAMFVKKDVFLNVGGFDEDFFMYVEENDLCWRVLNLGYNIKVVPKSIVYHYGMVTSDKYLEQSKIYYLHRNGLFMLIKNYGLYELLAFLPLRVFFDLLAFFYYLYKVPRNSFHLVRAYMHVLQHASKFVRKRDAEGGNYDWKKNRMRMPVPIQYFLFKRRTYNELTK